MGCHAKAVMSTRTSKPVPSFLEGPALYFLKAVLEEMKEMQFRESVSASVSGRDATGFAGH